MSKLPNHGSEIGIHLYNCISQCSYTPWKSWKTLDFNFSPEKRSENPGILNLFLENPGKLRD